MTQEIGRFNKGLAVTIGLEAAAVFDKLLWCVESPTMQGTIDSDGLKMIRNPITCTDPRKLSKSHGKYVDWLSNFPWLTPHKLRSIFAKLEGMGLIIVRRLRAHYYDQCKYYSVNYNKLTELLKPLEFSICANTPNRSNENDRIDRVTERKSYQNTFSIQDLQLISLKKAGGTIAKILESEEEIDQEKKLHEDGLLEAKVVTEPLRENEVLQEGECSVRSGSVERQLFFEKLLEYCYQRADIDSPEGYANWVMRESKSIAPEASAALLWDEFTAGEELGSRLVPPGFKLRGVPEQVVAEAIAQDCASKVGATATEAAKNAAGQLRRLPVVAAVATAVKLQLERTIESATRQVELGVSKERAIANNLPTYATACVENALPELEPAMEGDVIVEEVEDPYAPTPENVAAREKAKAKLRNVFSFAKPTKAEAILAANIAEIEKAPAVEFTKAVVVEECDDDGLIPW